MSSATAAETPRTCRSAAEAYLRMDTTACARCGALERFDGEQRVVQSEHGLLAVYDGACPACREPRQFTFRLSEAAPPASSADALVYGGERPSELVDPGEFLEASDRFASAVPAMVESLDSALRSRAIEDLRGAIGALDEVLKFIPEGAEQVPESAFFSETGHELYRSEPGRFRGPRLRARRGAYVTLLREWRTDQATSSLAPTEKYAGAIGSAVNPWQEQTEGMGVPPSRFELHGYRHGLKAMASLPHALGAMLGLAVGDALGTTNEFREMQAPAFPEAARGPVDHIVGEGPFNLQPGQVTDDTQMAVALAGPLAHGFHFSLDLVVVRYLEWSRVCFDIGNQISSAMKLLGQDCDSERAGRIVWEERERFPAGNGSLMRTVPIGVILAADPVLRRRISMAESATTHFDPKCQLACAVFNAAVAHGLTGSATPLSALAAARTELPQAVALAHSWYPDIALEIDQAAAELSTDLDAATQDDPQLYGPELDLHRMAGFVRVAFRLAFWELLHRQDTSEALIDVANRGGDADTNCAIAGALLGAVHGIDALPAAWIEQVMAAPGVKGPRWDFHPRGLVRALAVAFDAPSNPEMAARLSPYLAAAYPESWGAAADATQRGHGTTGAELASIAGCRLTRRRGGTTAHGYYDAITKEGTALVVSTRAAGHHDAAELAGQLSYTVPGVAPCRGVSAFHDAGRALVALLEERPAGHALSTPNLAMAESDAMSLFAQILEIVCAAQSAGIALGGLQPELVYSVATPAGPAISGVLPRWHQLEVGGSSASDESSFHADYRAPELRGGGTATAAADVYSACAILYFLLFRESPYRTNDAGEPEQAPPLVGLPPRLGQAARQGLALDPQERPSAGALLAELALEGIPVESGPQFISPREAATALVPSYLQSSLPWPELDRVPAWPAAALNQFAASWSIGQAQLSAYSKAYAASQALLDQTEHWVPARAAHRYGRDHAHRAYAGSLINQARLAIAGARRCEQGTKELATRDGVITEDQLDAQVLALEEAFIELGFAVEMTRENAELSACPEPGLCWAVDVSDRLGHGGIFAPMVRLVLAPDWRIRVVALRPGGVDRISEDELKRANNQAGEPVSPSAGLPYLLALAGTARDGNPEASVLQRMSCAAAFAGYDPELPASEVTITAANPRTGALLPDAKPISFAQSKIALGNRPGDDVQVLGDQPAFAQLAWTRGWLWLESFSQDTRPLLNNRAVRIPGLAIDSGSIIELGELAFRIDFAR